MDGAWSEVPRTLEQRRALLDQLSAQASPGDMACLTALRQAIAESDSAVQAMAPAATSTQPQPESNAAEDALHVALRQSLLSRP
jgi:hypothetical protein